jgi:hypothetical protein
MPDPYFSEIKYLGGPSLDFIEVAVDAGTDVSDLVVTIYLQNGNVRSSNPLAGLTPITIAGRDVYVIDTGTSGTFTGLGKTNGLSLSDDTTVYSFFSFDDRASPITAGEGPADGLTSTQIGMAGAGESLETDDGGSTYTVQTNPNSGSVPCLTLGTEIATTNGAVKVEDLKPGTEVITFDNKRATLLAVFRRDVAAVEMARNPNLYPVRITKGALGNGLPHRDLLVSRQHRMIVSSPIVDRMFAQPEVLIAAVRLTDLPGIAVDNTVTSVTYFHLLFAAHEVVFAEGAPTESLFLGDQAMNALPPETIAEIETLFPALLQDKTDIAPGRPVPSVKHQRQLVARHVTNQKPVLASYQK